MSNRILKTTNSQGVTLVEVMISLVILLVVFMGLIQASLLSINHNLRNEVRDEAVRVAAEYMTRTRSEAFVGLSGTTAFSPVTRNFRNLKVPYNVVRVVTSPDANTRQIVITVTWQYPGEPDSQSHRIYYTMKNPVQ